MESVDFRERRSYARKGFFMLTIPELTDARDKLRTAGNLIEAVRSLYLSAAYIQGAALLLDAHHLVADEIAALDKAISGAAKP